VSELKNHAEALARCLGEGWRASPPELDFPDADKQIYKVCGPDGMCLSLYNTPTDGLRVRVLPTWPKTRNGLIKPADASLRENVACGFALTRDPDDAARFVSRKLHLAYREAHKIGRDEVMVEECRHDLIRAVAVRLSDIFQSEPYRDDQVYVLRGNLRIEGNVSSPDSVKLTLSHLPADLAEMVLSMVAGYLKGAGE
jgi:hypothetical protein